MLDLLDLIDWVDCVEYHSLQLAVFCKMDFSNI